MNAFFCFFTLVTGPRMSLSLKLSDTRVHGPYIRVRLGNHNTPIQIMQQGIEQDGRIQLQFYHHEDVSV